jgi:DNA mismatch repair protein MutS
MNLGTLLVYPWIPGSMLRLGENALVQLHMIVMNDEKQDVLSLFDICATPMGHRGIRERLLKPSADAMQITRLLDAVESWIKKPNEYKADVVKRLRTMTDVHRLFRRIQQGTVTAADLMNLDSTFKAAEWIAKAEGNTLIVEDIQVIRSEVFKIFDVQKVYMASDDTSLFVSGLCTPLDSVEEQIKTQFTKLDAWIQARATSISVAADIFKNEFREKSLVIKGPRAAIQNLKVSGKLPSGITAVTNKTSSHLESPELDTIFAAISRLRESLKRQQSVQLVEHGSILASSVFSSWLRVADFIVFSDVNLTLARVASDMAYTRPDIVCGSDSASVEIRGLRHPLLEAQDRKVPYVQHDVTIGAAGSQGWLLYGLNASGKSSLMRATGLAVLLAQGGSFVPASAMRLSPFTSLHTRIINTDNLWMGLSSFAVEMSEMRDIFRDAGTRSLVLGDELCSGTETTSATALVAAGLRGLLKRGAKFLFATHLHGLSEIQEVATDPNLKIKHLHVEYDRLKDKLIYHRSLKDGPGSSLYGLEVAKAMRIPDDILEDAIRFRKRLAGKAELSESVGSSWNSSVIRRVCENCGASEAGDLEVHHIQERSRANATGRLPDGSSVHSTANLIVLCDTCHDRIHGGDSVVGPILMTSDGPERSITEVSVSPKPGKWTREEEQTIESVSRKFQSLSSVNLSKLLLNQYDIKISSTTLKKYRN